MPLAFQVGARVLVEERERQRRVAQEHDAGAVLVRFLLVLGVAHANRRLPRLAQLPIDLAEHSGRVGFEQRAGDLQVVVGMLRTRGRVEAVGG
jgi:hypothetical protein